jgi:hypothetical protein
MRRARPFAWRLSPSGIRISAVVFEMLSRPRRAAGRANGRCRALQPGSVRQADRAEPHRRPERGLLPGLVIHLRPAVDVLPLGCSPAAGTVFRFNWFHACPTSSSFTAEILPPEQKTMNGTVLMYLFMFDRVLMFKRSVRSARAKPRGWFVMPVGVDVLKLGWRASAVGWRPASAQGLPHRSEEVRSRGLSFTMAAREQAAKRVLSV